MKNAIVNAFRSIPLHHKVLTVVEILAALFVIALVTSEKAQAQSGNVYAPMQAQAAGEVWSGQVLQVSIKQVEASNQARAAGGASGGVLGLVLANRSGTMHNRIAVSTLGTVLGGVVGERVANSATASSAQEILVRLEPVGSQAPRIIVIIQPLPADQVVAGELVYVTRVQGSFRVLPRRDALL